MKVQAQHLQAGDIVGSGEKIAKVDINSIHWPSNKVCVTLIKPDPTDSELAILRRAAIKICSALNGGEFNKTDSEIRVLQMCAR